MSINNEAPKATTHPDYDDSAPFLKAVRDCVVGPQKIKSPENKYIYLPNPSDLDTTSPGAISRYARLLCGAELESFTDDTRRELVGKMRINDTIIDIDSKLDYLIGDVDGDGTSMASAIELAVNNVVQVKLQFFVVDFKNGKKAGETPSKADVKITKPRAVIKQYARENLINWHFERVNGIMQPVFLQFMERTCEFNTSTGESDPVQKYLVLALDENGDYYQAKYSEGETLANAEKFHQSVGGKNLKHIPFAVACDEEIKVGELPIQAGFLSGIADATLHRYRVSANYKETQRLMGPTIFNKGWQLGDIEIFSEANNGRTFVATGAGAVNNMPNMVESTILSSASDMTDFQWYFEDSIKRIRALGGSANSQNVAMTATEAEISSAKQNALLNPLADNIEATMKRMIFWCGVLEGIYQVEDFDNVVDDIVIEMPRDFATPKLTVEEVDRYVALYLNSIMTREQVIEVLLKGGWLTGEIDELLAKQEEAPPVIIED